VSHYQIQLILNSNVIQQKEIRLKCDLLTVRQDLAEKPLWSPFTLTTDKP